MSKPRRISELGFELNPQLSDVLPIVSDGSTKKIAYGTIKNDIIDGITIVSGGVDLSGYATTGSNEFIGDQTITGSLSISETVNLPPQDPLPSGQMGDLAASGSNLFFYNGTWNEVTITPVP